MAYLQLLVAGIERDQATLFNDWRHLIGCLLVLSCGVGGQTWRRDGKLRRALGFWPLVLFGLVYMAPIAPFTMFGFIDTLSGGAIVASYVLGAIGLGLTGLSYAAMVHAAPEAGSVYAFVKLAMGRRAGFVGAWAIALDYVLLGVLCLLYGALYLQAVFPAVPVLAVVAGLAALTLLVNVLGIHWSSRVDFALAALQIGFGVIFAIGALGVLSHNGVTPVDPAAALAARHRAAADSCRQRHGRYCLPWLRRDFNARRRDERF